MGTNVPQMEPPDNRAIVVSSALGQVHTLGNWQIVGTIIRDERRVEIVPREGIHAWHWKVLRAVAQCAACGRIEQADGWRLEPGIGWHVDVRVWCPTAERHLAAAALEVV